jgi:two-component system, NtrC family, response regulator HydG
MIEKSILIIDDDVHILHAAHMFLKRYFVKVDFDKNPSQLPVLLKKQKYDLVLLDMNFHRNVETGQEGFQWLDFILDNSADTKIILFTAFGDVEMAVRAIKNGAADFILKPWENDRLLTTIQSTLEVQSSPSLATEIIYQCGAMQEVMQTAKQIASTDANILILGENGTGKDLLAKEIHNWSNRNKKKFVHADLGAISESLFESELFGHTKGAFTDAKEDKIGRLQEADGGTIFLDEIGNIPLALQSKLLFSLQNKSFIKVGSSKVMPFDARLISATNENITQRIEDKSFRQDLFYRINTIQLTLPPLRDRDDDVLLLAEHFLKLYNAKYNRKIKSISSTFEKKLLAHTWPGNIRELMHAIERAVILSNGIALKEEQLSLAKESTINAIATNSFQLDEVEKNLILKMLKKYNGNITEASKELGLSRQALYRRIEKYGL